MSDSEEYAASLARAENEKRSEQLRQGEIGFAKGTLIHTREGLRAIEQIGIGDFVLTTDAPGAGLMFRPVVRTTHARAQIVRVLYRELSDQSKGGVVDTTLNHLFWIVGDGWTEARHLFSGFGNQRHLSRQDGIPSVAEEVKLVFATAAETTGWISYVANSTDEAGYEWDFASGALHERNVFASEDADDSLFRFEVYELEVDGSGIFFIGKEGLLVRRHQGVT